MNYFLELYKAGAVKRYHTQITLKEQDLAAHSWGVAMIVAHIAPDRPHLLRYALIHDLHEVTCGDIPYTAKREHLELADGEEEAEQRFHDRHDMLGDVYYSAYDMDILKWADMAECYLWSKREVSMGNHNLAGVVDTAYRKLRDMGPPTTEADELFQEMTE
jgi:5'-deoxynucleotidase YfbR-like HD superfamily hydrolase